jgi:hypothetical protein
MSAVPFIVARKELRELLRDRQVLWAAVIVWLLVAAAVATAGPEHRRRAVEREALSAEAREQWLSQGSKNPHTAAHFGVYAIKPQTPLAIFDPGVTTFVGTLVLLEAHWQNPQQGRTADASPASYRFGSLSPAIVLQQLLPLIVFLLGYGPRPSVRQRPRRGAQRRSRAGCAHRRLAGECGVWRWRSGFPLSPSGINRTTLLFTNTPPALVSPIDTDVTSADADGVPNLFANPAAAPAAFTYARPGTVGARNVLRAPAYFVVDLGLHKSVRAPWASSHRFEVRVTAFNALNTANFSSTDIDLRPTSPTSGRIRSTAGPRGGSRELELAVRYQF